MHTVRSLGQLIQHWGNDTIRNIIHRTFELCKLILAIMHYDDSILINCQHSGKSENCNMTTMGSVGVLPSRTASLLTAQPSSRPIPPPLIVPSTPPTAAPTTGTGMQLANDSPSGGPDDSVGGSKGLLDHSSFVLLLGYPVKFLLSVELIEFHREEWSLC